MGTTISAVSLMLVMAIGVSSVQNSGTTTGTSLGIMGHFEIMVVNPDGTTSYAQSDNFITGNTKDNTAALLLEGTAFPGGVPNCIKLGTGTAVDTADGLNAPLDTTATKCVADGGGASQACNADGTTQGAAAICTSVTEHTMAADCSPSCVISEASFGAGTSGGGNTLTDIFSYTALSATVTANTDALVTTTYKIATGGVIIP